MGRKHCNKEQRWNSDLFNHNAVIFKFSILCFVFCYCYVFLLFTRPMEYENALPLLVLYGENLCPLEEQGPLPVPSAILNGVTPVSRTGSSSCSWKGATLFAQSFLLQWWPHRIDHFALLITYLIRVTSHDHHGKNYWIWNYGCQEPLNGKSSN